MRKIQVFVLFIALLLVPSIQSGAEAAKHKAPEPEPVIEVMDAFKQHLQADPFLSDQNQQELNVQIEQYLDALLNRKDKAEYAEKNHLKEFVQEQRQTLAEYQEKSSLIIENILQGYDNLEAESRVSYRTEMESVLNEKFTTLGNNLKRLNDEIETKGDKPLIDWENLDWKLIGIIAGALLFLIILIVIISKSRKKGKTTYRPTPVTPRKSTGGYGGNINSNGQQVSQDGNIVVRRKTATILKKQSLEDVIDNPNYLQVDAIDFTYESAVRRMYIKNTCIIDIYNMYAEDLRNPDSPKEDGCMVLGRWVHDPESNEYYVSLEEIVLPGDDAVFEEYALNFGGKIKLKVLEQLRKLRRETNLQYDLTCWVHSHPGLGVFFSNSDTSVQDQLKHPTHPNFLTAIVVDILTPMQELGVFTFRRDTIINSKNDLKKM